MCFMKKFLFLVSLFFILFDLTAQSIRVGLLNGPTCIPAAYIIENDKSITFQKFADPQALLPKLIKKEIDVGFMPLNVAAKVYNSGNKVLICSAVTGLGNLSLITTDPNLRRIADLKGKKLYVAGQGATPEYLLRYILEENKLTYGDEKGKDLSLDFSIPTAQLASQLISGKIKYALVPEPFATIAKLKSDKVRVAVDLQKEYLEITGEQEIYPLSVMVVRADYAKENAEIFDSFLTEYEKAVSWTINNPKEAGILSEKNGLGLTAEVVENSIPLSNYTFLNADKSVNQIEAMLLLFLKCDTTSIGGKLPDKDFYYARNLKDKS